MGVHQLSKLLRPSDDTPDAVALDTRLHGKRIGVDFMVVGHKSVGSSDGAAEMAIRPKIPNSVMVEKCTRLCGWAKRNSIKWVVSVDGIYHAMKGNVNDERKRDRERANDDLRDLLAKYEGQTLPEEQIKEAKKFIKKAAYVSDEIVAVGVKVFKEHGHEVYGTCYESDFQLVYWEKTGFTDGTLTIDSDIYAMGSQSMLDLVQYNSKDGNCKLLIRSEVQGKIMQGSENWTTYDMLLYSALSGCDFIPRLFRVPGKKIVQFMQQWKSPERTESLDAMLDNFSQGEHWPSGLKNNKPGLPASPDFKKRVKTCVALMTHAPVVNEKFEIVPMEPLPADKVWADEIGFDPLTPFADSNISIEDIYKLTVWARTNMPLPIIPLPKDPNEPTRDLPHCAFVDFNVIPVELASAGVLLLWLFYHGTPLPKSTKRADIIAQVRQAQMIKQDLDEERIAIVNRSASSYVSCDSIKLLSTANWTECGSTVISAIRDKSKVPTIDAPYLDREFGSGKNGVRLRAWLRFESGHLDIKSLRMTYVTIEINGKPEEITIFEMKVTPSMKNVVYNVHLVFNSKGQYLLQSVIAPMDGCSAVIRWPCSLCFT